VAAASSFFTGEVGNEDIALVEVQAGDPEERELVEATT
jgi:hypothetical protein